MTHTTRRRRHRLAWATRIMGTSKQGVVARLLNIEKLARYWAAGDTEDFDRFLLAWIWCNPHYDIELLMKAAVRMGGSLTREQAEAIMDEAEASYPQRTATRLGEYLQVTDEIRERLKLWTIRPIDMTKQQLADRRRERDRVGAERRRRERGARPQELSLSRTEPWVPLEMSRATWYRQQKANGTAGHKASETTSSAVIFLTILFDKSVSQQAERQRSGLPPAAFFCEACSGSPLQQQCHRRGHRFSRDALRVADAGHGLVPLPRGPEMNSLRAA